MSWTMHAQTIAGIGASTVVIVGGMTTATIVIVKKLRPISDVAELAPDLKVIVEDHKGVAGRPGVPGREPLMATLARAVDLGERGERGNHEILRRLARVEYELHPNGGQNLRGELKAAVAAAQTVAQVVTAQAQGPDGSSTS